jgi:hypothetical protein
VVRVRSGERGLLARSARQLSEHKIPSASCRRLQPGSLRSPELGRAMTALFVKALDVILPRAIFITCLCIALRELRARRDTSC